MDGCGARYNFGCVKSFDHIMRALKGWNTNPGLHRCAGTVLCPARRCMVVRPAPETLAEFGAVAVCSVLDLAQQPPPFTARDCMLAERGNCGSSISR